MQGGQGKSLWRADTEIFVVSALILYLELLLIRWIGMEIRGFAYLGNLILVVCFFGTGLGCYLAARPLALNRLGLNLLLLVTLVSNPLHSSQLDFKRATLYLNGFEDSLMFTITLDWTWVHLLLGLLMVGIILYLLTVVFLPAGQVLGRALNEHPRTIRAYSVNIAGSLAGVWLLNGLSLGWLSPAWWLVAAAALAAALVMVRGRREWMTVALMMAAAPIAWIGAQSSLQTVWSPYHKLTVSPGSAGSDNDGTFGGQTIEVNGTFFQDMQDR